MTLSVKRIARLVQPGRYADGHGLYLQVTSPTSRSWIFRYERSGRERWMGLGPLHTFNLDEARALARKARQQLREGQDPLEARKAEQHARQLREARTRTFKVCADDYFEFHQDKWRNDQWRKQFGSTMRDYVFPKIGNLPVAEVDTAQVLRCVEPIWKTIPPTARRVLGRIEDVLGYATVHKYREGLNPARWDGHLENVLPRQQNGGSNHHDALPYAEMPEFMASLRAVDGIPERALELLCLTAMRTAEVRLAQWSEFDLDGATWTVPAARMKKSTSDHRVPLSKRAVDLLRALPRVDDNVFPSVKPGTPIGSSTMLRALGAIRAGVTVHGFRSTFRDWAAETTGYPNHVVEMALAHSVGSAVEKAYRRGDLLEKRKRLMQDWSSYCAGPAASGAVVPLRRSK